jgi:hypothetical protein
MGGQGLVDSWHVRTYLEEIVNQADIAQLAVEDLNHALRTHARGPRPWAAIQSLLAAGAMISKLLDPNPFSKNELKRFTLDRGQELLERVPLPQESKLKDRRVRNAFEHFDEELDKHFFAGHQYLIDRNIAPLGSILPGEDQPSMLRHLDNQTMTVSVLGVKVDLQELWDAIDQARQSATRALQALDG